MKSRNLHFISKVNTKSRGESEEASPIPFDLKLKSRSITRVWKSFFELYPKEFQTLLLSIGGSLDSILSRTCRVCREFLSFEDFFTVNSALGIGKALSIWNDQKNSFMCLTCY